MARNSDWASDVGGDCDGHDGSLLVTSEDQKSEATDSPVVMSGTFVTCSPAGIGSDYLSSGAVPSFPLPLFSSSIVGLNAVKMK